MKQVFRIIALAMLWTSAITPSVADTNELKTDGPWAYMKRLSTPSTAAQYMATTVSQEDNKAWLVLVCDESERINASIVRPEGFPYPLPASPMQVTLIIGNESVSVAAAHLEARQIVLEPRSARALVPQIVVGAEKLVAAIPEASGLAHRYSFELQPSMRALRDIGFHCYHPST